MRRLFYPKTAVSNGCRAFTLHLVWHGIGWKLRQWQVSSAWARVLRNKLASVGAQGRLGFGTSGLRRLRCGWHGIRIMMLLRHGQTVVDAGERQGAHDGRRSD